MDMWPKLELTDYERKFVRPYKTGDYPGVLRRTYERTISNTPDLAAKPGLQPSQQVQISRRSRVFGITFTGGLSATRLQITNASGTLYNVADARTGAYPYVASMVPGSPYMFGSAVGAKQKPTTQGVNEGTLTQDNVILSGENGMLVIDPNWVLIPNETLIFNGNWDDLSGQEPVPVVVLNIAVHVWEFPRMGMADLEVREVI
jgi:hypothetical protein